MSTLPPDMVSIPRATVERLLAMVEESGFTRRSNFFVKEVVDILALSAPPASPDAGRVERVEMLRKAWTDSFEDFLGEVNFIIVHEITAALATPSAPEDAKGEGVTDAEILIVLGWTLEEALAQHPDTWIGRAARQIIRRHKDHPNILASPALRAAASNTEREG